MTPTLPRKIEGTRNVSGTLREFRVLLFSYLCSQTQNGMKFNSNFQGYIEWNLFNGLNLMWNIKFMKKRTKVI